MEKRSGGTAEKKMRQLSSMTISELIELLKEILEEIENRIMELSE